jgi:NADH-ubiquinone oxidoreductase chain 6
MYNLILLSETYTNGYKPETLYILSLAAILCGILVIISKNPIVSVLFLIGLFSSIASYLIVLGLNFIGLSYLLVYVGAVSILFLFILMLINVRVSELWSNTSKSIPLAIFIGISFNYLVYPILPYNTASSFNSEAISLDYSIISDDVHPILPNNTAFSSDSFNSSYDIVSGDIWSNNYSDYFYKIFNLNNNINNGEISLVTSKIWDSNLAETSHITSIGNIMYTSYSIWLILTSIILLLAMVGAIVITIKQRN